MSSKGEQTKTKILNTALDLMESQGFHKTGLQQIIQFSGMPKGSLYFHFPEGKDQIAALALTDGALMINTILDHAFSVSESTGEAIESICESLSRRLVESDFTKGCPVSTAAMEVGDAHPCVRRACENAYSDWIETIANGLSSYGYSRPQAKHEASLILSMIEGALILAKVKRDVSYLASASEAINDRLSQVTCH